MSPKKKKKRTETQPPADEQDKDDEDNTSKQSKRSSDTDTAPSTTPEFVDDIYVFQCQKCLSIVGDTSSFVTADTETKTVTLKASSCVSVSILHKDLETSKSGFDVGSTFWPFKCANCEAPLGKVYKTTASHLDFIRDYFTFDTDAIVSYKIGSFHQMATNISFQTMNLPSVQAFQKQESNLVKMQQIILLFKERLSALEAKVNELSNGRKG